MLNRVRQSSTLLTRLAHFSLSPVVSVAAQVHFPHYARGPLQNLGAWAVDKGMASSCSVPLKLDPEAEEAAAEIDTLLKGAMKDGSLERVSSIIEDDGEKFADRNVVTAMAAMAALARGGGHGEKEILVQGRSFQTLVDMVLLGSRRYSCPDLLSVLSSCGAVGCDDDHLIDKVTTRLLSHVSELDAGAVHDLVTSLGELSSPSIVLFDAIQARVQELGDQLSPQQRKDIKAAYQALGYDGHADAAGV